MGELTVVRLWWVLSLLVSACSICQPLGPRLLDVMDLWVRSVVGNVTAVALNCKEFLPAS